MTLRRAGFADPKFLRHRRRRSTPFWIHIYTVLAQRISRRPLSMSIARQVSCAIRSYRRPVAFARPLICECQAPAANLQRLHYGSYAASRAKLLAWQYNLYTPLYPRPRRKLHTSPINRHGHMEPPKPGEEYAIASPCSLHIAERYAQNKGDVHR